MSKNKPKTNQKPTTNQPQTNHSNQSLKPTTQTNHSNHFNSKMSSRNLPFDIRNLTVQQRATLFLQLLNDTTMLSTFSSEQKRQMHERLGFSDLNLTQATSFVGVVNEHVRLPCIFRQFKRLLNFYFSIRKVRV